MIESIGFIAAAMAAIGWGSQFVLMKKLKSPDPYHFHVFMSIGIFLSSFAIGLAVNASLVPNPFGLFSGLIWGIANFAGLNAVALLGLAVGFPLTQLALLVSVAWGLLYFKEIKGKDKILKIVVGAIVLIAGAFLLAFSKI
jgi:glucose uptake protein GlcU